jgi:hypothetical protein
MANQLLPVEEWTKGEPVRVCQTLPPVTLEPEVTDEGAPEDIWTVGRTTRAVTSLPPVTVEMEDVPTA